MKQIINVTLSNPPQAVSGNIFLKEEKIVNHEPFEVGFKRCLEWLEEDLKINSLENKNA